MTWLAVLLGGALGSAARHGVNLATVRLLGTAGPSATAIVNLVGTVTIGVLAGALAAERISMSPALRAFVFVGLLGGFTTFSSLMLDSLVLLKAGSPAGAAVNLVGQFAAGVALVLAGYYIGLRAS
jgi:fluoride exporter